MTKSLRSLALLAVIAVGALSMTACGTGTGGGAAPPAAASAASAPAASHYKADLAAAYDTLALAQTAVTSALQAHKVTADEAQAVRTQCKALTTLLDGLAAAGDSTSSEAKLAAAVAAVNAVSDYLKSPTGVPK